MMNMPNKVFLIANVTSAILWSFIYILPGILIGAAASELSKEHATKLIIFILAGLIILWLGFLLAKLIAQLITKFFNRHMNQLWRWIKTHPKMRFAANFIRDPIAPASSQQLSYLVFSLLSLLGFIAVILDMKLNLGFAESSKYISFYVQKFHSQSIDLFLIIITSIGNKYFILSLAGVITIYLAITRHFHALIYWLSIVVVTFILTYLIKHSFAMTRPPILLETRDGSSFPSGHVTLSLAIIGFFCFLFTTCYSKVVRQSLILPAFIIFLFIIISRLVLGAHWLADTLGAICLGGFLLFFHIFLYNRNKHRRIIGYRDSLMGLVLFLLCWSVFLYIDFPKLVQAYKRKPLYSQNFKMRYFLTGKTIRSSF